MVALLLYTMIAAADALYVGVVVYGTPQEWLSSALLFGEAIGFGG